MKRRRGNINIPLIIHSRQRVDIFPKVVDIELAARTFKCTYIIPGFKNKTRNLDMWNIFLVAENLPK